MLGWLLRLLLLGLALSFSGAASAIDMKVDRVTVNTPLPGSAPEWTTVAFRQAFGSVPVVIVTATDANADPATVRIRNVTTTGFEMAVIEPPGADGANSAMTVDYFAAETGRYWFGFGGAQMVVGTLTTDRQRGKYRVDPPAAVSFPATAFSTAPAVVAQVQTVNSQNSLMPGQVAVPWLDVAVFNVSADEMAVALDRAKTTTGTVSPEVIGYVAMESGDNVSIAGETIQALRTGTSIRGWDDAPGCYQTNFVTPFAATPKVVASKNTVNGTDYGWIRRCGVSATAVGLVMDEDQSDGTNRSHGASEIAGVMAYSGDFSGLAFSFAPFGFRRIEGGSVAVAAAGGAPTLWTRVDFPNAFSATPIIFTLPTDQGSQPAAIRVRNVATNGFEVAAFNADGGSPPHPEMTIDYLAIIPGTHTTASGDSFVVDSLSTTARIGRNDGSADSYVTQGFGAGFAAAPAVLAAVQSNANEPGLDPNGVSSPWMTTAIRNVSATNMQIAIERAETSTGSVSSAETIGFFAVADNANGSLLATDGGSVAYEMQRSPEVIRGWADGCFDVDFVDSYSAPHVLASQNTRNGGDGGWVRRCDLQGDGVGLQIDEDTSRDADRNHIAERAGVFVFSRAFEAVFGAALDHYGASAPGQGVTCQAIDVEISAQASDHSLLDPQGGTVTVSTSNGRGTWSGAGVTDPTPGDGVATVTLVSGGSLLTRIQLSYPTLLDASGDNFFIEVFDSGGINNINSGSANSNPLDPDRPAVAFDRAGFRFFDRAAAVALLPTQVAGMASSDLYLQAIRTNPVTGACAAVYPHNSSVEIDLAGQYQNPATGTVALRVNGSPIDTAGAAPGSYTGVNLAFEKVDPGCVSDCVTWAPIELSYEDVGTLRLHASDSTTLPSGDSVTLRETSNPFVVRPHQLVVTAVTSGAVVNPQTGASGAGFIPAATPFRVAVEARHAGGGIASNYGNESTPEGAVLSIENVVFPTGSGVASGVLSNPSAFSGGSGLLVNATLRWSEVGSFTASADVADGDYLGSGEGAFVTPSSETIGRFYPADFELSADSVGDACGTFSYLSQPQVAVAYTLTARNLVGNRVVNYDNSTRNYPTRDIGHRASQGATDLSGRLVVDTAGASWQDGEYRVNTSAARIDRLATPDGPYPNTRLRLSVGGGADTVAIAGADELSGSLSLRFGRARIDSAHGPESAPLAVTFGTEYWNGSQFIANLADGCSAIDFAQLQFAGNPVSAPPVLNVLGDSDGQFSASATAATAVNGSFGLWFSAAGISGQFPVDANLTLYPWLRSDWNQNGDHNDDNRLPTATVSFGTYRGHDRVLYWRERLD